MHAEIPPRIELPPSHVPGKPPRATRRGRSRREETSVTPDESALFDALRVHRLELARATGVPPYVVAHDRTLHDMARLRPGSLEDLLLVDGIGPAKAERYGEGLLEVVRRHAAAN